MKALLTLTLFFVVSISYSQEWEFVSATEEHAIYMRKDSDELAWFKYIPYKGELDPPISLLENQASAMILYRFDCRRRKFGWISRTTYTKEGKVVDSEQVDDYYVKMEYAVPESVGDNFLNSFCRSN